ncbi:MAG: hypothetical protein JSW38_10140 [Dehalococcoidia bacterium]|nr:MAG: hypothetical protein JSW38_10140 [Dehalococcoidia bacterium]
MLEDSWHFSQKDNTGALEAFDNAISLKPNNAVAWHGRGIDIAKVGKLIEALDAFNKAINLNP